MYLKSINSFIEDKVPLFCKYIIVSFFQQVKNYIPNKKSSYANLENNNIIILKIKQLTNQILNIYKKFALLRK